MPTIVYFVSNPETFSESYTNKRKDEWVYLKNSLII